MHHAHATPAAAPRRFDDDWVADARGDFHDLVRVIRQSAFRTGYTRHTGFFHGQFGADFIAHQANRVGTRAYENKAAILDALSEVRIF